MNLYFVTGNKNKFKEARLVIPYLEQLKEDLIEIQEVNPMKIIKAKLSNALEISVKLPFVVEDTSLHINCLNGLPGPLIKWFLKSLGDEGIYNLTIGKDCNAEAKTLLGYASSAGERYYYEGLIKGKIVSPRGNNYFGWNRIFQPDGSSKTFGEMTLEEKDSMSMRAEAFRNLRNNLK
jgi:non-canonical purine NTP pyrophosphatase (RdgB/HAM1 family)